MKFSVAPELFKLFPQAKIAGIFIHGITNTQHEDLTANLLKEYINSIFKETERLAHKNLTSWGTTLDKLNIDRKKVLPSHIALLQRAIKKGDLPSISSLVNVYNLFSLKNRVPIGGHDTSNLKHIHLGLTKTNDSFTPMGETSSQSIPEGEWAYRDPEQRLVLTRHVVWRQSDDDKITKETTSVFIPIDDIPNNFSYEELETLASELAGSIIELLGGTAAYGIVNKYNTEIDSSVLPECTYDKKRITILQTKRMDVITDEEKVEEVLTKGIKDIFPGKDALKESMLSGKRLKLYTGIDPTANFIHMGHMIWMKKLREFQKLGHEVIFLIGGFTAMIGDPDKTYTREPLTREGVKENFQNYKADAAKILDFDWEDNPILVQNNYDWLSQLTLDSWIHIMSNVTLQHILSHDMFRNRLEEQTPIRLHEIVYPLLQGYDSVHMEVDLEVGGSDQTFNMLTGRVLERNIIGKEKHVLTMKLLTDNNGKKMGKTTGNAISFKDSPRDVYGKVMSFADEILPLAYELLSEKNMSEIESLTPKLSTNPMEVKKDLAFELTKLMHSEKDAEKAAQDFTTIVQNKEIPDDIPTLEISDFNSDSATLVDIIYTANLTKSRGETKRLAQQGGIKVNDEKILDTNQEIPLTPDTIIQIGKRKWVKLI
ncbi:tyrosine--tRNA ligase [Candidatus Dojkabacteria bacterium]|uniref:Tyrosine--tRNA ligase n=1 Tax=Candidatus Dojkabacteria bacterium TaxID=2099670 RepID=A0A955L7I1_9BACT|nr:tyrosine--tRNA ligase [Candidatus Dojkabacteria bacterium]